MAKTKTNWKRERKGLYRRCWDNASESLSKSDRIQYDLVSALVGPMIVIDQTIAPPSSSKSLGPEESFFLFLFAALVVLVEPAVVIPKVCS